MLVPKFQLFHTFIFLLLPFHILTNLFFVQTSSTYKVSFCPKVTAPLSLLQFQVLVKYFDGAFPFQNPTTSDTENLGGIDTIMWTWSSWTFISSSSSFFHSQSWRKISSTDCCNAPFIILNRYFGHHIIWYLHCHTACANFLKSLIEYLLLLPFGPPSRSVRGYSIFFITIPSA